VLKRLGAAILLAALAVGGAPAIPAHADQFRDEQAWTFQSLDLAGAWQQTQGQGVTVAVLDTGVAPHIPDLDGSVSTGPDYTKVHTPTSSSDWGLHGTMMATLIAGHGHAGGGEGVLGVASRAKILSIRMIVDKEDPNISRLSQTNATNGLVQGIHYAVDHGASVISMSLGFSYSDPAAAGAIRYALDHGVVLVASAGNSGEQKQTRSLGYADDSYPAAYPGVVSVAAVNRSGNRAGFSSANVTVSVAAPGVHVTTAGPDGNYWWVSGTSPACALVAGVAALIKSRYPTLAPGLVAQALSRSTRHRPAKGYDDQVGFGVVDATAALAQAGVLAGYRQTTNAGPAAFGTDTTAIPPRPPAPDKRRAVAFGGLGAVSLGALLIALILVLRRRAY
jgi:type VII secretion-associated serine protease mycosin